MVSAFILSLRKKKHVIRTRHCDIITYIRCTIKIFADIHRFAVSASPRIDFIFHIPPTEEGTIVRMIPPECENGVTLLFRRRSYPLLQILLFTRFTLSLTHCAIFFSHWIYDSSDDAHSLKYKFYKMLKFVFFFHIFIRAHILCVIYYCWHYGKK